MATSIGNTCTRDICIGNIYAVRIWIGCAGIGGPYTGSIYVKNVSIGGVEPRALARLKVIFAGLGINNCFIFNPL